MRKIFLSIIIFAAVSFSQSLLAVRYPIGLSYPTSTQSARMAGTGAALSEPYLVSLLNPGNLGSIKQSVYTLSANWGYTRIREEAEHADFSNFSPAFIGFAFPIGKAGTIGASFKQNSTNSYSYREDGWLKNSVFINSGLDSGFNFIDSIKEVKTFKNSNAFSSWEFGWGIKLFKKISIGASYQIGYYKNIINRSDALEDNRVYSGFDSLYYSQANSALRGGIIGQFGKLEVGVSATYQIISGLNARRSIRRLSLASNSGYNLLDSLTVFDDESYKLYLPPSGIIGATWTFNDKIKTTMDASMVYWKEYWTDAPFLTDDENILRNTFSISSGTQFIPQPNLLSSHYFQKVRYSGGISYRQLPIIGDWEISGSAGAGFPLGKSGILDFSVETGRRQSKIEKDIHEQFVRINFGMSGGQQWKKTSSSVY